ncbi:hypothetical protein E1B28_010383 [Marasmius oreades]|uniref:Uncharacterized protein n=1 Tax=Marasmius oreades TaxID=181124 RepID=A0A9P7URQ3_9AGAR|nr:uncharacterized protein E1B28_010383 [Marasmius oreades]KAG7091340.1 hypothetical protein E1B28_010383 [Marasmius oreades]
MPASFVNDLLCGAASDPYITPPAEFALVLNRNKQPINLTKALPHDGLIQSDFINEKMSSIVAHTTSLSLLSDSDTTTTPAWSSCISVVLDERSMRDKTCVVVKTVRRAGREDGVVCVRIPFTLTGCLFGIHTGLGLALDAMVAGADEGGVFRL